MMNKKEILIKWKRLGGGSVRSCLFGLLQYCVLSVVCLSCSFGDEPNICPYNTRLEYWSAANSHENVLPAYVDNVRQYLFDSSGNLLGTNILRGDSVAGWNTDLPPGEYTMVVWGNLETNGEEAVEINTEQTNKLSDLTLNAVTSGIPPGGYRGNTGRLYYGTTSFKVEEGAVTRQRVYLSHAHAVLSVTVQWLADAPPEGGTYRMQMTGIPGLYGFMKGWETEMPSGEGVYSVPYIGSSVVRHETRASMNYDGEVVGQFVTFRYTSGTHQLWSLWRNDKQIIKELDLYRFFTKLPMDMNQNIEQEFDLLITVYKDKIVIVQATAADWDEGGTIG